VHATKPYELSDSEQKAILDAANIITMARTAVEHDCRGDVIDAHAPEMPTRLAKQLAQIMRGALAIGFDRDAALLLALRCARDSMPPLRLEALRDVAQHPGAPIIEIRRRLQKPRATVDRTLQALHCIGLLNCQETETDRAGKVVQVRHYSLTDGVNLSAIETRQAARF
jgi:DNA-binding MarR family transcriptional regulator